MQAHLRYLSEQLNCLLLCQPTVHACQLNYFATCKSIFKYIFTDVVGMTKECLELIYSEVKEKSQRMNMWKGSRNTKAGKIQDKYLKVS